jgi:amidohydrolase
MKSNNLFQRVEEIFEEIKEFRRYLHQNPEISFNEINTTKYISEKLTEFGIYNYPALKYPSQNPSKELGVIAEIGSGDECIALRADIDALPINEETGLSFCSIKDGIMHACGHDMHTAILLASAKILKSIENELTGKVILIFQPAEELLPGGAKLILESGVLKKYNISAFFGQHVNPEIELGKVSVISGPIMASTDELHITIKGQSSHAAQPHLGKDVILASTSLIQYYQNLLTKFKNPIDSGIISITSIHAGSVTNILPDEAKLLGTIRTYSQELRNELKKKMIENSEKVVGLYDCTIDLNIVEGYPPVINNDHTTDFFEKSARKVLGEGNVIKAEPKMWAEDFAYYSQNVPSTFWFLGIAEMNSEFYPLHNQRLNPSESALIYGTALMVNLAVNYFDQ